MNHVETTAVPIPTEEIENALLKCAIPGTFGSVRIEITLPPQTASELHLNIVRDLVHKLNVTQEKTYPVGATNERATAVKDAVREIAHKLQVRVSHRAIVAHFNDGKISHFNLEDVL